MVLGIDPGKTGAGALINPISNDLTAHISFKAMGMIGFAGWLGIVCELNPKLYAVVEEVHAMPGQGVVSMFNFGKVYGEVLGILYANHVPVVKVAPPVWKGRLGLSRNKMDSVVLAQKIFSKQKDIFTKKNEAIAEAALIAHYGALLKRSLEIGK
ncbi:MAG TPA: hypothetical protein PKW79_00175 [Rhabdochlamydiaceae bacterium]|nr:hypothetical protein [Rhabdochlamydiaceae bacterium]